MEAAYRDVAGATLRTMPTAIGAVESRIIDRDEAAAHMPRLLHAIAGRVGLRQYVLVRRVTG